MVADKLPNLMDVYHETISTNPISKILEEILALQILCLMPAKYTAALCEPPPRHRPTIWNLEDSLPRIIDDICLISKFLRSEFVERLGSGRWTKLLWILLCTNGL